MDISRLLTGTVIKPVFGAIVGFFIGTILLATGAGFAGSMLGAFALGLILLFAGLLDLLVAVVLWFFLLALESRVHRIEALLAPLSINQQMGGGFVGAAAEKVVSWTAVYLAGLLVVTLVLSLLKSKIGAPGMPTIASLGCGGGAGLVLGTLIWLIQRSMEAGTPAMVAIWVVSGALLGLVVGFLPGPPWE